MLLPRLTAQYDCSDKLKADTKEEGNNIIIRQWHRTVIPNFVSRSFDVPGCCGLFWCAGVLVSIGVLTSVL